MSGMDEFEITRRGGMLIVQVGGFFTVEKADELRQRILADLRQANAVKCLIDLRRCVLVMGEAQIDQMAEAELASGLEVATGVLASEPQRELVKRYAKRMGATGRTRLVFTDASRSLWEWLGGVVPELLPARQFEVGARPQSQKQH